MAKTFSTEQLTQITDVVASMTNPLFDNLLTKLQPLLNTVEDVESDEPKTLTPDPYLNSCYDAKAAVMKRVSTHGVEFVYVRGPRGLTEVNKSKAALNLIDDQIQDWKDKKTHRKVV